MKLYWFFLVSLLFSNWCQADFSQQENSLVNYHDTVEVIDRLNTLFNSIKIQDSSIEESEQIFLRDAAELALKLNQAGTLADVYKERIKIFEKRGDYENVLLECEKLYALGDSLQDQEILQNACFSYGNYFFSRKEFLKAIEWGRKSLKYISDRKESIYSRLMFNIGISNVYLKNFDSALINFKEGERFARISNDTNNIGINLSGLSTLYYYKGDLDAAIKSAEEAIFYLEKTKNHGQVLGAINSIGVYYFESGEFEKGIEEFKKALTYSGKDLSDIQAVNILSNISLAYEKLGNYKLAYIFLDSAYMINDRIYNSKIVEITKEMEAKFDLERKTRDIELLEQEKKTKELELVKQRQFNYGMLGFGILSIIIIGVLYKNNQLKKKANRLLQFEKQNEQNMRFELEFMNQKLMKENIMAQFDTLKNQINPHFLFNSLNALGSLISSSPEKAMVFTSEFAHLYRKTLEMSELHLITLKDEMELCESYLYLQKIRFGDNLIISKSISEDSLDLLLPPFSLQMLLENVLKHNTISSGSPLEIRIKSVDNYLSVENNIQTRKNKGDSTGIGLKNIYSRYELIGEKVPEVFDDSRIFRVHLPLLPDN